MWDFESAVSISAEVTSHNLLAKSGSSAALLGEVTLQFSRYAPPMPVARSRETEAYRIVAAATPEGLEYVRKAMLLIRPVTPVYLERFVEGHRPGSTENAFVFECLQEPSQ